VEPATMTFHLEPELRLWEGLLHRGGREHIVIYLWKGSKESVMILIISNSSRLLSFVNEIILFQETYTYPLPNLNYSTGLLSGELPK
jgi:hypothetical protein